MFSWLTGAFKRPPNAADAMKRFLIFKFLFIKALSIPPKDVIAGLNPQERSALSSATSARFAELVQQLQAHRLWCAMTDHERYFMEGSIDQVTSQDQIDASWLAEPIGCLLWALNLLQELPRYDEEVKCEFIQKMPSGDVSELLRTTKLRPFSEIRKQRDWAELWNWRCRTTRLLESGQMSEDLGNGMKISEVIKMAAEKAAEDGAFLSPIDGDFPWAGKPFRDLNDEDLARANSIAEERHRTFNWLCGYAPGNRWDQTPTGT